MGTVLNPEHRDCYRCGQILPLDQFRKRRGRPEGRGGVCRRCTAKQERFRQLKKRRRIPRELLGQLAKERDLATVAGLIRTTVRRVGGVDQLSKEIVDSIRSARPGSRDQLVGFRAIMKTIAMLDEHERERHVVERQAIASLDDAELERQIEKTESAPSK